MKDIQEIYEQRREWENKYNPINLRKEIEQNKEYIERILQKMEKVIEIMLSIPQPEIKEWIIEQHKEEMDKLCAVCGAELMWSQRKYCSESCYMVAKEEYMREYRKSYYEDPENRKKRTEYMKRYRVARKEKKE